MHRRHLLTLLGAALPLTTGCLTTNELSLENFSPHEELEVTLNGEVIQQQTEDSPPRIEIRFTNEGQERRIFFGPVPPGSFVDRSGALVMIPDTRDEVEPWDPDGPDRFVPDSRENGCWRSLATPSWRRYLKPHVLATGEQIIERYTVMAHPDAEVCFPSGSHRFEATFKLETHHPLAFDVVVP